MFRYDKWQNSPTFLPSGADQAFCDPVVGLGSGFGREWSIGVGPLMRSHRAKAADPELRRKLLLNPLGRPQKNLLKYNNFATLNRLPLRYSHFPAADNS